MRRLIADIVARGVAPAGCIVGEPTGMELVVAHKGKKRWRCRVRGFEAHSLAHAARRQRGADRLRDRRLPRRERARDFRDDGRRDDAYDVPYTTIHVGTIRGGTALNIVPRDCTFDFEIRHLPFDDPDALFADVRDFAARFLPAMHAVEPDTVHRVRPLSTLPGFDTQRRQRHHRARPCLQRDRTASARCRSAPRRRCSTAPAIPTVICGPGHIAQAHQPNEWVSLEQIARCEAFMRRLAERLAVA